MSEISSAVLTTAGVAVGLAMVAAGPSTPCDLTGQWKAANGRDTAPYACVQSGESLVFTFEQGVAAHWRKSTGSITAANAVTITTDTHHTLRGPADQNCSYIAFATPWCRVGSADCGRPAPPGPGPPPPPPANPNITKVQVAQHFASAVVFFLIIFPMTITTPVARSTAIPGNP